MGNVVGSGTPNPTTKKGWEPSTGEYVIEGTYLWY